MREILRVHGLQKNTKKKRPYFQYPIVVPSIVCGRQKKRIKTIDEPPLNSTSTVFVDGRRFEWTRTRYGPTQTVRRSTSFGFIDRSRTARESNGDDRKTNEHAVRGSPYFVR